MILIKSNDQFFLKNITNLFDQIRFNYTTNQNHNYFFEIEIILLNKEIKIINQNDWRVIKQPFSHDYFMNQIREFLYDMIYPFKYFDYKPISQVLSLKGSVCILGAIHNKIISNLLLNLNHGVNKVQLYKEIWPFDKEIFMNKLDTHITNLKNKISNDLDIEINISSMSGNLKLVTN